MSSLSKKGETAYAEAGKVAEEVILLTFSSYFPLTDHFNIGFHESKSCKMLKNVMRDCLPSSKTEEIINNFIPQPENYSALYYPSSI